MASGVSLAVRAADDDQLVKLVESLSRVLTGLALDGFAGSISVEHDYYSPTEEEQTDDATQEN